MNSTFKWALGTSAALLLLIIVILILLAVHGSFAGLSAQPSAWRQIFSLFSFLVFSASALGVACIAREEIGSDSRFLAALVGTAALIPITIAEVGTVTAYVLPLMLPAWALWVRELSLLIGSVAGLVTWTLAAFLYQRLAQVDTQNSSEYQALQNRYTDLECSLSSWCPTRPGPSDALTNPELATRDAAFSKVQAYKEKIAAKLGIAGKPSHGLDWVSATGYINLWTLVHDAEEELFELAPVNSLQLWADQDRLRIQGSSIPNSDTLLNSLKLGISSISPNAASLIETKPAEATNIPPPTNSEVRVILRNVRDALNSFRDSAWDGLVRQRNHLIERVIFTRITTFLLLGLLILVRVPPHTIFSVGVFYLVGASFGYVAQMNAASSGGPPVEDYGLSSATLLQTTLFSGLAGVAGVLVLGLTTDILAGNLKSNPSAQLALSNLSDIFDVGKHQFELVVAAIFGLTPQLLLNRLQDLSKQYKLDIGSSEATGPPAGSSAK